MIKLWHKIKRYYQRTLIKSKRQLLKDSTVPKSIFESQILQIARALVQAPNVVLSVCPDTGRRFIENEGVNMIIEHHKVTLTNTHYYYEIAISEYVYEKIRIVFDGNVRKKRDKLYENIIYNASTLLTSITK